MSERQWPWNEPGSMIPTSEKTAVMAEETLNVLRKIEAKLDAAQPAAQGVTVPSEVKETIEMILKFARFDDDGTRGHIIGRIDAALTWLDTLPSGEGE